MVLIDSPFVVYREPDPGEEQFPVSVKEAFYRTIGATFKETQVIILENDERPIDLGNEANIVFFTGKRTGRWGFSPSPPARALRRRGAIDVASSGKGELQERKRSHGENRSGDSTPL